MALEPVQLDDLTWSEMVLAIRRRIAANSDGKWTLHAPVDPGLTLLELFAWLLEQRVYWMNQVPDAFVRAALALLGEKMQPARSSATVFQFPSRPFEVIPTMTRLRLKRRPSLIFSTQQALTLLPVERIGIQIAGQDRTADLEQERVMRLLPSDGSPAEITIVLWLKVTMQATVPDQPFSLLFDMRTSTNIEPQWSPDAVSSVVPAAQLSWWYRSTADSALRRFAQVDDGTGGFRRPGIVKLSLPVDWQAEGPADAQTGLTPYALFVRAARATFTAPPRLNHLVPNVAIARHQYATKLGRRVQWLRLPGNTIPLDESEYPPLESTVSLSIKERDDKWYDWKYTPDLASYGPADRVFLVDRQEGIIRFGDGLTGRIPVPGSPLFVQEDLIDHSSLFSLLRRRYDPVSAYLYEQFTLQMKQLIDLSPDSTPPSDTLLHTLVAELNRLLKGANLYDQQRFQQVLTEETRMLLVQNPQGNDLIRLNRWLLEDAYQLQIARGTVAIRYQVGGGSGGNLGDYLSWEGVDDGNLKAKNVVPADGGKEPETTAAARERTASILKQPHRAITREDYEELALTTPGIAIERAHAAVGFHPDHPCTTVPGAVTVFVVPDAPREEVDDDWIENAFVAMPAADPGALQAVRTQLNMARLVTSEVFVRNPRYRPVALTVTVEGEPLDPSALREQVKKQLQNFLDPLDGGDDNEGWPFGEPLRPSVLLRETQHAVGEAGDAISVSIKLLDTDVAAEDCSDVRIGEHELVALREVTVQLRRSTAIRPSQGGLR
jgi:Baseplate J-like protein